MASDDRMSSEQQISAAGCAFLCSHPHVFLTDASTHDSGENDMDIEQPISSDVTPTSEIF